MTQIPGDTGQDPKGIDQQLDAGVASQDHLGDDTDPDLGSDDAARTNPDDTKESIKAATEMSEEPS